ncbi:MAG TPA: hypothetical protein VH458_01775 [Vicinamibacterales bacterium]|jgi:hypothetical protein
MGRIVSGVVFVLLIANPTSTRASTPNQAAAQAPRADAPDTARDGWVVLSVDEYRALRARALALPPEPPPPVDAALTRVDYDLRLSGDTVTGDARLTIDVLKQGWVSVLVPPGVLVRDARLDGRPTAIVDGDPPRVLIARAGRTTLNLGLVVPLAASAGTESMTLPPSGSALSAVSFTIPRTGVDLSVSGGLIAEQAEGAAESRWVVYGSPGRPMTFSWKRKADDHRATLALRTRARIIELVALGEDSTQVTTSVHLEVTQGLARQAALALPEGLVVNQVSGATVADWNADANGVTVTFLEPIAAETSFVVSAEARLPREGGVSIPLVRMPSADREVGGVAVDVVGPGEINERQPRNLEPADPSDLGDIVAGRESPSMAAFQFTPLTTGGSRALTVNVSRYTPQAVLVANVEEARYDALLGEDGKLLVRARYAVRNNQRSFLAVVLPSQASLWSASLAGRPVRPGLTSDGGLLLPLQKGRSGEPAPVFLVELVYLQRSTAWSERGDAHVELPATDLPVSRSALTLHYPPRYLVNALAGAFRVTNDPGPWSGDVAAGIAAPAPAAAPVAGQTGARDAEKDLQALMDRYKKESGRTRQGTVPITIDFPEVGPSIFLAAELTAESHAPSLDLEYRKTGGRR